MAFTAPSWMVTVWASPTCARRNHSPEMGEMNLLEKLEIPHTWQLHPTIFSEHLLRGAVLYTGYISNKNTYSFLSDKCYERKGHSAMRKNNWGMEGTW